MKMIAVLKNAAEILSRKINGYYLNGTSEKLSLLLLLLVVLLLLLTIVILTIIVVVVVAVAVLVLTVTTFPILRNSKRHGCPSQI